MDVIFQLSRFVATVAFVALLAAVGYSIAGLFCVGKIFVLYWKTWLGQFYFRSDVYGANHTWSNFFFFGGCKTMQEVIDI